MRDLASLAGLAIVARDLEDGDDQGCSGRWRDRLRFRDEHGSRLLRRANAAVAVLKAEEARGPAKPLLRDDLDLRGVGDRQVHLRCGELSERGSALREPGPAIRPQAVELRR